MDTHQVDSLEAAVRSEIGEDATDWYEPDGYESVALAVLDSIYSTGNHYTGVINLVNKYRAARTAEGGSPDTDTATDLVEAVGRWGGIDGLVDNTNQWKTSSADGAPPKAVAAYGAAQILQRHGLETVVQVRDQLMDREDRLSSPACTEWLALPGQSSGLTWGYFLMLCGVPGVKADRMILRYVRRVVGDHVNAEQASELVENVAGRLGTGFTALDHAIWRMESGRPVRRKDETDD